MGIDVNKLEHEAHFNYKAGNFPKVVYSLDSPDKNKILVLDSVRLNQASGTMSLVPNQPIPVMFDGETWNYLSDVSTKFYPPMLQLPCTWSLSDNYNVPMMELFTPYRGRQFRAFRALFGNWGSTVLTTPHGGTEVLLDHIAYSGAVSARQIPAGPYTLFNHRDAGGGRVANDIGFIHVKAGPTLSLTELNNIYSFAFLSQFATTGPPTPWFRSFFGGCKDFGDYQNVHMMGGLDDITNGQIGYNSWLDPVGQDNFVLNNNLSSWTTKTDLPNRRFSALTATIGSRIFYTAGVKIQSIGPPVVWEGDIQNRYYDMLADSYATMTQLPTRRCGCGGGELDSDKYLVTCGYDIYSATYLATQVFSTSSDSWVSKSDAPNIKIFPVSGSNGSKVWVFNGYSSLSQTALNANFYTYSSITEIWDSDLLYDPIPLSTGADSIGGTI